MYRFTMSYPAKSHMQAQSHRSFYNKLIRIFHTYRDNISDNTIFLGIKLVKLFREKSHCSHVTLSTFLATISVQ